MRKSAVTPNLATSAVQATASTNNSNQPTVQSTENTLSLANRGSSAYLQLISTRLSPKRRRKTATEKRKRSTNRKFEPVGTTEGLRNTQCGGILESHVGESSNSSTIYDPSIVGYIVFTDYGSQWETINAKFHAQETLLRDRLRSNDNVLGFDESKKISYSEILDNAFKYLEYLKAIAPQTDWIKFSRWLETFTNIKNIIKTNSNALIVE